MNQFAVLAQIVGAVEQLRNNADNLMVLQTDDGGYETDGMTDLYSSIDTLTKLVSDLCGVMTEVSNPKEASDGNSH